MLLCELWLWLCTFAGRMTTILKVQDEIRKVQGELEELRKRLQEEVPEAKRAHLWKQDEIWKVQGELEELRKRLQEEVPEAERAHLWKKEDLLMKKKEQLRHKELLLMQSRQNNTALVQ